MDEVLFEIREMLRSLIDYWRKSDEEHAKYYIDAYRCVEENIKTFLHTSASKVKTNE